MLPGVTRLLALAGLVLSLALPIGAASEVPEQSVVPLAPAEQRVEPLVPQGEQQIEAVDQAGLQGVGQGTKSESRRAAETAGKVVLGVFAAAIALAAAAASLLLL